MRIAVLGTGAVGKAIATKLAELGHEVAMGSRSADNENAREWAERTGGSAATFADAAAAGSVIFNCTAGAHSLEALDGVGTERLGEKLLIDVANPLDFSGDAPRLTVANDDSLAEQIQRAFPRTRVVKALNTMNCEVMVDPSGVPGDHVAFVCGDDDQGKAGAIGLLGELGWPDDRILDLGGLSAARGMEMYLPLWISTMQALGTSRFNIEPRRGD